MVVLLWTIDGYKLRYLEDSITISLQKYDHYITVIKSNLH